MASWKEFLHPRDKNGEFKIAGGHTHPNPSGLTENVRYLDRGTPSHHHEAIHQHQAQAAQNAAAGQEQAAGFLRRHGAAASGGHTLNASAPSNRQVDPADVKALETRNMFGG